VSSNRTQTRAPPGTTRMWSCRLSTSWTARWLRLNSESAARAVRLGDYGRHFIREMVNAAADFRASPPRWTMRKSLSTSQPDPPDGSALGASQQARERAMASRPEIRCVETGEVLVRGEMVAVARLSQREAAPAEVAELRGPRRRRQGGCRA
jgi:hypothetical protein